MTQKMARVSLITGRPRENNSASNNVTLVSRKYIYRTYK